jgi:DNA-binding transcriptional MerR regulator
MPESSTTSENLSAAECAKRTGLTIRALRLYESKGLISPNRTPKGWRFYGAKELERLNEIQVLKQLGLSLASITTLLASRANTLDQTLALQHDILTERQVKTAQSLNLIKAAREKTTRGETLSTSDLISLVKGTTMSMQNHEARAQLRYEQTRPRIEMNIEGLSFLDYVGFYQHSSGDIEEIKTRDGGISSRITGQMWIDQFCEGTDKFFFKVIAAQTTFQRDAGGKIVSLIEHQGGFESLAKRITSEVAAAYEEAVAQRIKLKTPIPGSAEIVRSLVLEQQHGAPDYNRLAEPLGLLVREQQSMVQPDLMSRGDIKDTAFRGVADDGADVYEITFTNDSILEWRFAAGLDGKIHMMWFRPIP